MERDGRRLFRRDQGAALDDRHLPHVRPAAAAVPYRYTPSYLPVRNVLTSQRIYDGKRWYLRRGMSPAAVPGTSNHGWALANDIALCKSIYDPLAKAWVKKIIAITADAKAWQWVQDNAMSFGFGWEGARPGMPGWEPWHIRYWAGDRVPQRVKDVEAYLAAAKP